MELQVKEIERTIKQLNDSKDKDMIYRSVGSLLIQTDDKEGLLKELNEQLETFNVRVKSFENQEKQLKERYDSLQKQITQELGGAGGQESEEN